MEEDFISRVLGVFRRVKALLDFESSMHDERLVEDDERVAGDVELAHLTNPIETVLERDGRVKEKRALNI